MEATVTRHISSETPRVMVVDGSKLVRRMIEGLLAKDLPGATVISCGSGEEAKAALASGVIDLVTTALRLPDMDGVDLVCAATFATSLYPNYCRQWRCQRAHAKSRAQP
jgi:DNA-binding NtrC family response regulator